MGSERDRTGISEIESDDTATDVVEPLRQPIGSYLRRQRKLRGISAEELARSTRIPLRSLERLEAGSFDDKVDGFVRGFVRTVAEALGLDPDDTLARMLAEPAVQAAPPLHLSQSLPRAAVGLVVVVMLAAAVGIVRVVATDEPAALPDGADSDLVYRRDPVRALAESQRAAAADAPPPALVSPPAEAPAPVAAAGLPADVASADPASGDRD